MADRPLAAPMYWQVLLLASAQALFQTASVLVMTIGGLAGATLAPSPEWATAPIATMFLGTAIATVPASMWMARVGRRIGFLAGASDDGTRVLVDSIVACWDFRKLGPHRFQFQVPGAGGGHLVFAGAGRVQDTEPGWTKLFVPGRRRCKAQNLCSCGPANSGSAADEEKI